MQAPRCVVAGRQVDDPGDTVLGGRVAAGVGLRARVPAGRASAGARHVAPAARPPRRARAPRSHAGARLALAFTARAATQGNTILYFQIFINPIAFDYDVITPNVLRMYGIFFFNFQN